MPLLHEAKLSLAKLLQENWEEFVQLEQLPKEARNKVLARKFQEIVGEYESNKVDIVPGDLDNNLKKYRDIIIGKIAYSTQVLITLHGLNRENYLDIINIKSFHSTQLAYYKNSNEFEYNINICNKLNKNKVFKTELWFKNYIINLNAHSSKLMYYNYSDICLHPRVIQFN